MIQPNTHPMQSLQHLSRLYQAAPVAEKNTTDRGWSGLSINIANSNLLLPTSSVVRILRMQNLPSPSRLPGSPGWFSGLVSHRGELIPTIDLQQIMEAGAISSPSHAKLICIRSSQGVTGLLVNQVTKLRYFSKHDAVSRGPAFPSMIQKLLAGVFRQEDSYWGILNLKKLNAHIDQQMGKNA